MAHASLWANSDRYGLATAGRSAEGGPVEEIRPGDVVWFSPDEKHWHGATPTTAVTHIAIQERKTARPSSGWNKSLISSTARRKRIVAHGTKLNESD